MTEHNLPKNWNCDIEWGEFKEEIEKEEFANAIDVFECEDGWVVGKEGLGAFGPWTSKKEAIDYAVRSISGCGDAIVLGRPDEDDEKRELLGVKQTERWSPGHGPADREPIR